MYKDLVYPCTVCGKNIVGNGRVIADLVYLGDRGELADLPPILGFKYYCPEHSPERYMIYSVKGEIIGTLGLQQHMSEMIRL